MFDGPGEGYSYGEIVANEVMAEMYERDQSHEEAAQAAQEAALSMVDFNDNHTLDFPEVAGPLLMIAIISKAVIDRAKREVEALSVMSI